MKSAQMSRSINFKILFNEMIIIADGMVGVEAAGYIIINNAQNKDAMKRKIIVG